MKHTTDAASGAAPKWYDAVAKKKRPPKKDSSSGDKPVSSHRGPHSAEEAVSVQSRAHSGSRPVSQRNNARSAEKAAAFHNSSRAGGRAYVQQKTAYPADRTLSLHTRAVSAGIIHSQLKQSLFDAASIPADAARVLNQFDDVIQSVQPLNSRQLTMLPDQIRALSHELTDERDTRRMGYMNQTTQLSAYVHYYMWWNLVRPTRLFAGLPADAFSLDDGDACVDAGSGPLTVVIALYLARPELRQKKLTWYCLDLSQAALSFGEELYLGVAARLGGAYVSSAENIHTSHSESESVPADSSAAAAAEDEASSSEDIALDREQPSGVWKIVRVKGPLGTPVRRKAALITCANMFNELLQASTEPPDFLAKKYSLSLLNYAAEKSSVFVVEPGVPRSARLVSLMRDALLRRGFAVTAPGPHGGTCPMDGRRGGKWCNFAFATDDAPAKLLKLSEKAGLPKERAVLSFVFAQAAAGANKVNEAEKSASAAASSSQVPVLLLRIASDPIRLPGERTGYYACSDIGLVLAIDEPHTLRIASGCVISVPRPADISRLHIDGKSGAVCLSI